MYIGFVIDMGNLKNKIKYPPNHPIEPLEGEALKDVDGSEGEEQKRLAHKKEYQRVWQ